MLPPVTGELKMKLQSTQSISDMPNHTVLWLGGMGLVPFAIPLLAMISAVTSGAGLHSAAVVGFYAPYVFVAYSAIILSFLSGVLWHSGRTSNSQSMANFGVIASNLIALTAWSTLLMVHLSSMMTLLAVTLLLCGYGILLLLERTLDSQLDCNLDGASAKQVSYWRMRLLLTTVVIVFHSLVLVLLIGDF
jgi:hypothetical protein